MSKLLDKAASLLKQFSSFLRNLKMPLDSSCDVYQTDHGPPMYIFDQDGLACDGKGSSWPAPEHYIQAISPDIGSCSGVDNRRNLPA